MLPIVVALALSQAPIYRWTDKSGEVHYTDDLSTVPRGVKVESTTGNALSVVPAPPPRRATPTTAPPVREVPRPAGQRGAVEVTLTRVEVEVSESDLAFIKQGIASAAASPEVAFWGPLRESVEVQVVPVSRMGHEAFGLAVGNNLMLLRAPKETGAWGRVLPYERAGVHELAHLIEHQVAGQNRPRWFAEGFAQYVAKTDAYASREDAAYWVIHDGGTSPLTNAFGAHGPQTWVAYGIALEAVRFLAKLVGDEGIKRTLALRGSGSSFDDAMATVLGYGIADFELRFIESLRPHYYDRAR